MLPLKHILVYIILSFLGLGITMAQQEPPLTIKDVENLKREQSIIKYLGIRMSKQLIAEIEDGKITGREALLMDVYYDTDGRPKLLLYYDATGEVERYTNVLYDIRGNKTEEVRFMADSSLINGVLFNYKDDDCLMKQADYNNKGDVLTIHEYATTSDSTISATVKLPNGTMFYTKTSYYIPPIDNGLLYKQTTYSADGTKMDSVVYEYNKDERAIRKETFSWYDSENHEIVEYSYNREGALSSFKVNNMTETKYTELEYDEFGNIIAFVTKNKDLEITKYIKVKHFNLTTK